MNNIDTYKIRHIQEQSYGILQFLNEICRKYDLKYYLAYGTLLGAVRHNGFIPWDDDVDVWMPRNDYMKLLEYLRNDNDNSRFVLNDGPHKPKGDRPAEFQMRILDLEGSMFARTYAGKKLDVYPWIDIFALDTFPIDKKEKFFNQFKHSLLMYKFARCKNFVIEQDSLLGKLNKIVYFLHSKFKLFFFISEEKCANKVVRNLTKYREIESEEYFCYAAVYLSQPHKCFFPVKWFGVPLELTFEDNKFYVPSDSHALLTRLYSDYMTLPPEEQRKPTHSPNE